MLAPHPDAPPMTMAPVAALATLLVVTASAVAQQVESTVIPDEVSCAACTIRLTRVAQLGNDLGGSEPGSQGPLISIARDSRGFYFAVYGGGNQNRIFVHAPDGRVVRTIGREGDGPGEFRSVSVLAISPGDTLHALDHRARRWTVFAPDGRVVRSAPIPGYPSNALPLPTGGLLLNGRVRSAKHDGLPLHLLEADGSIRRAFGADASPRQGDVSLTNRRELAHAGDAAFWALHVSEYRIDHWDSGGRRLRSFVRSTSWFRPWLSPARMSPTVPPSPHPVGFAAAGDDHVWTVTRIAAGDWQRGLRETRSESGRTVYVADDLTVAYDSMLEYVDLRHGKVVARARSSLALGSFADREHLVDFTFDDDGRTYITIWRVQLERP